MRSIRTPGGHRRFLRSEILAIVQHDAPAMPPVSARVRETAAVPAAVETRTAHRDDRREWDPEEAATVAAAVSLAAHGQADRASAEVVVVAAAVALAAHTAATAALTARDLRAQAAASAAEAVAGEAARTAAQVKQRTDASARQLSQAASDAAALVVTAHQLGYEREDAAPALQLALNVKTAAVAAAQDSTEAAAQVARAVAAAAAAVAFRVSAVDVAIESEVARVAAAVQAEASARARADAAGADARAGVTATIARDAARAVRRRILDRDRRDPSGWSSPVRTPALALAGRVV